jgi:hypothetical protein
MDALILGVLSRPVLVYTAFGGGNAFLLPLHPGCSHVAGVSIAGPCGRVV